MIIKKPSDIKPSEITPESVYLNRRDFIKNGTKLIAGSAGIASSLTAVAQEGVLRAGRQDAARV